MATRQKSLRPLQSRFFVPAEALRSQEEGRLECFGHDGKVLARVHLHTCGPEDALADPPAIARFDSMREPQSVATQLVLVNDRTILSAVDSMNRAEKTDGHEDFNTGGRAKPGSPCRFHR